MDRGAADTGEFRELSGAVGAQIRQFNQVLGLVQGQLRLLTAQVTFGSRDARAFAGPSPDQIGLELSHHRQYVEQQPTDRIGGIVEGSTHAEPDLLGRELGQDVAGIG